MLVLSRARGESIRLGDDIVVTVNKISANQVRLGITAPKAVRVSRLEPAREEPQSRADEPETTP
ncbi:MAG TPA: carbon storage regulator [Rhodanobacteraceae bacterium]|nr:carbon storage regulator [Rhodanobacteraceae bacterium]